MHHTVLYKLLSFDSFFPNLYDTIEKNQFEGGITLYWSEIWRKANTRKEKCFGPTQMCLKESTLVRKKEINHPSYGRPNGGANSF